MMTHDEMIEVIAAHRDGKQIQHKAKNESDHPWSDTASLPVWNFMNNDYRIKPNPLSLLQCWERAMMPQRTTYHALVEFLKLAKENGHL